MPPVFALLTDRAAPFRKLLCIAVLALLSACASQGRVDESREAAQYQAHAAKNYAPPGPPEDPWGPYTAEASKRFDVPERWIREVMRVESGGSLYLNGTLTTSPVGAMGLMQVMPQTYDELRVRYGLGDDAYDPHNNILAGAAYMREMYDLYGSPGFLAAYNAGPARVDDFINNGRALPEETRRYVANIGPYIDDSWPASRSPADELAMNELPLDVLVANTPRRGGPRYASARHSGTAPTVLAANASGAYHHSWTRGKVATASLGASDSPRHGKHKSGAPASFAAAPPVQMAMATSHLRGGHGFHLIPRAEAASLPLAKVGGSGGWAIQVGAYSNQSLARAAAEGAHDTVHKARPYVGSVRQGRAVLYRARLVGLSREAATEACERLGHGHHHCIVLSPDAQS